MKPLSFGLTQVPPTTPIKRTTSRCTVCHASCPAKIYRAAGKIYLTRRCPEHGAATTLISSDARFYHPAKGDPRNGDCGESCDCGDTPLLLALRKVPPLRGQLFHLYLIGYGLFRIGHEFLRGTPRLFGPFSGYQFAALVLIALGAWRFAVRARGGAVQNAVAAT